jgi:cytochrome c oxidase cbb3-type subunit 3
LAIQERNTTLDERDPLLAESVKPRARPSAAIRYLARLLALCLAIGALSSSRGLGLQGQRKEPGGSKEAASQATLIAGRQVFTTTCASCHGLDGRGGERAPNILARPEVQRMSDANIARVIREGTPSKKMPAFGSSFDDATLREVTAYLRTLLRRDQQSTTLPGDPVSGKDLFFGKARCADCHTVDGSGGFLGADLSTYARSHAAHEVRDAITDPNANLDRRQKTVSVVTSEGERLTGIARNEDNFSLQVQTPDGAFHLLMKSNIERIEYQPRSLMPGDYGQRLTTHELDDLVSFLMRAAATNSKSDARAASQKSSANRR